VRIGRPLTLKRPLAVFTAAFVIITGMGPGIAQGFSINNGPAPLTATAAVPTFPQQGGSAQPKPFDTSVSGGLDSNPDLRPGPGAKQKFTSRTPVKALTNEFTPHDKVYLNSDGTKTRTHSLGVSQYKLSDGTWRDVDSSLQQTSVFPVVWQSKSNSWQATFRAIGDGGVTLSDGTSTVSFNPRGVSDLIDPAVSGTAPFQTVTYRNVWPGVDLEYQVMSDKLKETIVVNHAGTQANFAFDVSGTSLVADPEHPGALKITNALGGSFSIPAPTVATATAGVLGDAHYASQTVQGSVLTIALNQTWLSSQPASAFPIRVDPTATSYSSSFTNYKSDGYVCGSTCGNSTGSVNGPYWRFQFHADYSMFQDPSLGLQQVTFHTEMPDCTGTYGTCSGHWIVLSRGSCIGFNCIDTRTGYTAYQLWSGSSYDIDATGLYQNLIKDGDWNNSQIVNGEEGNFHTYKLFAYDRTKLTFIYDNKPPVATPVSPANGAAVVTNQPTLAVNPVTDADGEQVQYSFRISTNPDAETGSVVNSGWQTDPRWTVPDRILRDGTTYYWHAYTWDGYTNVPSLVPAWANSFRVDLRNGKDATQTQDSVGGVSTDFATGNLSTSNATHSSAALGGSLGVGLNYNSPIRSKPGLVGKYWNDTAHNQTFPSNYANPLITRTDPNINFGWGNNSPGPQINSDYFLADYTGYFVAPVTASYQFYVLADDHCRLWVNSTQVINIWGSYCGTQYATAVSLTAGQVVPIQYDFGELTGLASTGLLVKINGADQGFVPTSWLQTGVPQAVSPNSGLIGSYYYDDGSHNITSSSQSFLVRNDPMVSFNWDNGGPISALGVPTDNFMARWTGQFMPPTSGSYTFGTWADDGTKITVGTTQVLNHWVDSNGTNYGTPISLTAGSPVTITVDYYEHNMGAGIDLLVQLPGQSTGQEVPSSWLLPQNQTLPDGWSLANDPEGNQGYDSLRASSNSVVLTDATGMTHEYTSTGTGYKPPVNEDGHLSHNADGTYTFQDSDGRTYVFNADGTLASATTAPDDRHPAALQYIYGGTPIHLTQISDAVTETTANDPSTATRWMKVFYGSDGSNCPSVPATLSLDLRQFVTVPSNMICAVKTNDGNVTQFLYENDANSNPRLSRLLKPGNDMTDYGYDTLGRIVQARDPLANDAVNASPAVRSADGTELTAVAYDYLGRVTSVTLPAANAGDSRLAHTYDYHPSDDLTYQPTGPGYTNMHVSGATEPNGYSRRITYDATYRTTADTDVAGLTTYSTWDPVKDLLYATTDPAGLMSTTNYDYADRPTDQYGPAPSSWFTFDTLDNNRSLLPGQSLWSRDGRFQFTLQTDGNIVEYGPTGVRWQSATGGHAVTNLTMQGDGNMVLYNGGSPIWWTGSGGGPTSYLVMQNDGNAVIYNSTGSFFWADWAGTGDTHNGVNNYMQPTSAQAASTPHTTISYDGSINGTATAYYDVNTITTATGNSYQLYGAPKLHATGIASGSGDINKTWNGTPPFTLDPDPNYSPSGTYGWGARLTGDINLASTGTYSFRAYSDDGVRLYIDDTAVIDDWNTGSPRSHTTGTFATTASTTGYHRIRLDYFNKAVSGTADTDAVLQLFMTPPGGAEATVAGTSLKPHYGLTTSQTTYDSSSSVGNRTATTSFGSNPELSLPQSSSVDPSGLNLTTSSTYETQGASGSYLRQLSKALPGGATTNYTYYGGTETRQNPCDATKTYAQAGMVKLKTEPDPDGAGSQTSRVTETVYDDAGRVVATRYNSDSWTCTTYDSRGRVTQVVIPAFGLASARTVTNNYSVGGNPLVASSSDAAGAISTSVDLLGRTTSYTDALGNTTTTSYDSLGRMIQRGGPLGTEAFTYDNYNRLSAQKLNGTTIATPSYDSYGRISSVAYNTAGSMSLSISRDSLGRPTGSDYTLGNGTTHDTDSVTLSQSGKVVSGTELGLSKSYTYDAADRLTTATIGANSYGYSFAAPSGTTCNQSSANLNAHKDSNRTSFTKNGVTTTYCYDNADRLLSSSDAKVDAAQYDSHGNTTQLGTSPVTTFGYDSSDRNTSITEGSKSVTYTRDVQNRILTRVLVNGTTTTNKYGFTGTGDSPDLLLDGSNNVVERYIQLPGGVLYTKRSSSTVYSLPNVHGDVMATTDASGTQTGTFTYDPFGNPVSSSPDNTASGSTYGWVGQHEKDTETAFALAPTEMGARVYLASIGRFLQVDPVEGGTPNNYVYPPDPVNKIDADGRAAWLILGGAAVACYLIKPCRDLAVLRYDQFSAMSPTDQALMLSSIYGGHGNGWGKGRFSTANINESDHYDRHGTKTGTSGQSAYTANALRTVDMAVRSHRYRDGSGRIAFQDAKGRITVMQRGKIVTYLMPDRPSNYWQNIVRRY
jgi:RHS repeat-associated protein